MRTTTRVLPFLLIGLVTIPSCVHSSSSTAPSTPRSAAPLEDATVAEVIDGDTITVTQDGRAVTVRLLGIDTPETKRPDTPVECFGEQAHRQLASLLPAGTTVQLEHDVERLDRYQRELAYVRRATDGLFVNIAMVRDGFAAVLTFAPNVRYADELNDAGDEAHLTRRGLWGACGSNHRTAG